MRKEGQRTKVLIVLPCIEVIIASSNFHKYIIVLTCIRMYGLPTLQLESILTSTWIYRKFVETKVKRDLNSDVIIYIFGFSSSTFAIIYHNLFNTHASQNHGYLDFNYEHIML